MSEHPPSNPDGPAPSSNIANSAVPDREPRGKQHRSPGGDALSADEQLLAVTDGAGAEHTTVQATGTPAVQRGLSAQLSTKTLQSAARLRALLMLNRFRVMRTIDIAVLCYPERPFKAALTAAQRAVRGMVKEQLIRRYKSDRFQTIYGLTARGVRLLHDHRHEGAAASVRRVADMTNPEHRLWLQLLVLAAEARGLRAETEQELLRRLNLGVTRSGHTVQGLLRVTIQSNGRLRDRVLRPDAFLSEHDGATWIEVDRSKRGAEREASLRALAYGLGAELLDGQRLRRVVIFCKNERIQGRALALLRGIAKAGKDKELVNGRRVFNEVQPGTFEVHAAQTVMLPDRRVVDRTVMVGHVVVQLLPTWLPKARISADNALRTEGWLHEDYLPYRRSGTGLAWPVMSSPLLVSLR